MHETSLQKYWYLTIWRSLTIFQETDVTLFVIDCSVNETELIDAKFVLEDVLNHPLLSGKPALIFANKVDAVDCDTVEVINRLAFLQVIKF